MKALGIVLIGIGITLFLLCFFVFAPFLCKLIPQGEYKGFFDAVIYLIIAWIGGAAIPFFLILYGILSIITGIEFDKNCKENCQYGKK
jgi:hypothetical protein